MTSTNIVTAMLGAVAVSAALHAAAQGVEQSPDRGQMKSLQCVACHGPNGISPNPMIPHLAGQNARYITLQLEHFKEGERYHPVMTPVAESLSEQDIADLAVYFSRIGPLATVARAGSEAAP